MTSDIIEFPTLNQPEAWDDPILFDYWQTPEIKAQCLPGIFGEYAAALAHATETPEALTVMTILGVLSTIVTKQVFISPKQNWCEPINIYTLIALPPANHKSLVLKQCMQPVVQWEKEQKWNIDVEIKRLRSERKTQEKRVEALRIKAAKAKTQTEYLQLKEQAAQQEKELVEIPIAPMLFINDVTPESLATVLHEQGGRLSIFSDEGGVLETLAGLYSQGTANIDILLKGIDGGDVRVRRKDRSFSLNPYLTILLAVQPAIVSHLSEKKAYLGNGTLERFLYVLPNSRLGYRTHETPSVPESLEQTYTQIIRELLDKYVSQQHLSSLSSQLNLTLSPTAQLAWRDYQDEIEVELRPDGKFEMCMGWAGKMPGFSLRLAGLLHVANNGDSLIISDASMQNALTLAHALGEHALAAFGLMDVDSTSHDAQLIFNWLQTLKQPTFTQSELTYAWRHRKWRNSRLKRALQVLHERHLISEAVKLPTRKPTRIYYIHPSLVSH